LGLALLLGAFAPTACSTDDGCPSTFDRSAWRAASAGERYELAVDVDRCNLLEGVTKQEVRSLLDPPISPRGPSLRNSRQWEYYLGDATSGDARYLYVKFSRTGRVTDTAVDPE
jgi:hypothetical protein